MATKITIQELVTRYVFEVDRAGAKEYDRLLDKSTAAADTAANKQISAAQRESNARKAAAAKSSQAAVAAAKKKTIAEEKASTRAIAIAQRESTKIATTQARAAKAHAAATTRESIRLARLAERTAAAQVRAADRAAAQRIAAEARVAKATDREARRAANAVIRENKRAAASSRKAGAGKAAGGGGGAILAGAAVGAMAAGAAIKYVGTETERLDKIAKGAQKSGLGFDQYQRLAHVAELSGSSIDDLSKGTRKLTLNLRDIATGGGKKAAIALEEIGLSAADLAGKSAEEQFAILADGLAGIEDDAQKSAIAFELFGKAGTELVPMLNAGGDGIREMSASVKVMSREQLAAAEAYQDSLTELDKAAGLIAGNLVSGIAPAMTAIAASLTEWLPQAVERFDRLYTAIEPIIKAVGEGLYDAFTGIAKDIGELMDSLEKIGGRFEESTILIDALSRGIKVVTFPIRAMYKLFNLWASAVAGALGWVDKLLGYLEDKWPRAFGKAADVVKALTSPIDTAQAAMGSFLDWLEKAVSKVGWLADKVREIKTILGVGAGTGESGGILSAVGLRGEKVDNDNAREKSKQQDLDRREAARQKENDHVQQERKRRSTAIDDAKEKKPKGGGGRKQADAATGLQAEIEGQFKSLSADAEMRASAQALREGKAPKEAFAIGKQAAKDVEGRLRSNFDSTGQLPVGISRDIQSLSRSPSVEDSIGRVPPPVISVVNNVNNVTISGNEFSANVDASAAAGSASDMGAAASAAMMRMLHKDLGRAVQNILPQTKV